MHKKTFTNGHMVIHRFIFLVDILDGLPSRPHYTLYLVAKGHNQYEHSTKALTHITRDHTGKMKLMTEAKVDNGMEFDTLTENLDSNMNSTGTGSRHRPLYAKPKKELTGNDKVKAQWMNDVNKFQSELGRGHNTFLPLRIKGSGMIKGKNMGVSKEMVQPYKQAQDGISAT